MHSSPDIRHIASNEVAPDGESVVWCGQPNPFRLAATTMPVFLFAVPWTAFSLFWIYAASGFSFPPDFSNGGFSVFPLFGIPFLLIGIGMLFSPVFAYAKAFRTVYVVTARSIRIITVGRTKKVETFGAVDIGTITRKEKPDGSGDIIFKNEITFDSRNKRKSTPVGFYGIPDVRTVEQWMIRLRHTIPEKL